MKKVLALTLLFSCLFYINSFSSVIEKRDSIKKVSFVIKTDFLFPVLGAISKENFLGFTLEIQFKKRHSFQLAYLRDYYYKDDITSYGAEYLYKRNTFILYPEYKFYVSKKKPHKGYYIGVFGTYIYNRETDIRNERFYDPRYKRENDIVYQTIGGGIMNGYQFYVKKHLTFDFVLGGGVGELIHVQNIKGYSWGNNYSPIFIPRAAITIGYKF